MKITIIQFDSRPMDRLGLMPLLLQKNHAYAARHGYDYRFVSQREYDLPVYWIKPKLCRQVLEAGSDIVAWIDTDAVVHDADRRIEDLFEGDEIMVGAPDNPAWPQPFNAGVFFVKAAGGAGVALMDRWSALFVGTAWTKTDTAWVCEDVWAGPSYEQGAFNLHLLEELTGLGALRLTDWRTLQSPYPMEGAFTLHFAGHLKLNLPAYLSGPAAP